MAQAFRLEKGRVACLNDLEQNGWFSIAEFCKETGYVFSKEDYWQGEAVSVRKTKDVFKVKLMSLVNGKPEEFEAFKGADGGVYMELKKLK